MTGPTAAVGGFPYPPVPLGVRESMPQRYAPQPPVTPKKPIPPDLAERAAEMGRNALALHYGLAYNTIVRMLRDAGLEAHKAVRPPAVRRAAPSKPREPRPKAQTFKRAAPERFRIGYAGPKSSFTGALPRDASTEGQAADTLRRLAAVYRCTERGRADPEGRWWRYGNAVLTGAELIQRAERHGFDPDAWRRLPSIPPSPRQGLAQCEGAR